MRTTVVMAPVLADRFWQWASIRGHRRHADHVAAELGGELCNQARKTEL
jgi:hypothetical protein